MVLLEISPRIFPIHQSVVTVCFLKKSPLTVCFHSTISIAMSDEKTLAKIKIYGENRFWKFTSRLIFIQAFNEEQILWNVLLRHFTSVKIGPFLRSFRCRVILNTNPIRFVHFLPQVQPQKWLKSVLNVQSQFN